MQLKAELNLLKIFAVICTQKYTHNQIEINSSSLIGLQIPRLKRMKIRLNIIAWPADTERVQWTF